MDLLGVGGHLEAVGEAGVGVAPAILELQVPERVAFTLKQLTIAGSMYFFTPLEQVDVFGPDLLDQIRLLQLLL